MWMVVIMTLCSRLHTNNTNYPFQKLWYGYNSYRVFGIQFVVKNNSRTSHFRGKYPYYEHHEKWYIFQAFLKQWLIVKYIQSRIQNERCLIQRILLWNRKEKKIKAHKPAMSFIDPEYVLSSCLPCIQSLDSWSL